MAAIMVPAAVRTDHVAHTDEKMRDSAIDIDMADVCGVLEHATLEDEWETDSSDDSSSILDVDDEKEMIFIDGGSLTESLLPSPSLVNEDPCNGCGIEGQAEANSYMSLNSSTSSLSSAASKEEDDGQPPSGNNSLPSAPRRPFSAPPGSLLETAIRGSNIPYNAYYDTPAYAYATTVQPAFPTVFDLFDYGDGATYYLGGGGPRITRHLSRRGRGVGGASFWPFANPPLYACRLHHPSTGHPPVVLYGGPDADRDGAWADVQFPRLSLTSIGSLGGITIGLPPMANRRTAWQPLAEDEAPAGRTEEALRLHLGWHKRYRFEVEVEADGPASFLTGSPPRREAFEWRYCSGAELEALEEDVSVGDDEVLRASPRHTRLGVVGGKAGQFLKRTLSLRRTKSATVPSMDTVNAKQPSLRTKRSPRWQSGWQLVRLAEAADPLAEAIQAAKSTTTSAATTTPSSLRSSTASTLFLDQLIADEAGRAAARRRTPDGREIVATWAMAATVRGDDDGDDDDTTFTAHSINRFTFLGSGASGQLGERWTLMAVASGLAVWERARRARRRRQSTVVQACGGLANIGA